MIDIVKLLALMDTFPANSPNEFPTHPSDNPLAILYIDGLNGKVFMWDGVEYRELAGINSGGGTGDDITLNATNFDKYLTDVVTVQEMADLVDEVNNTKKKEFLDKAYIELNETNNHLEFYTYDEDTSQFIKKFEIGGSAIVDVLRLIKGEKPTDIPEDEIALYNREITLPDNSKTIRPEFIFPNGNEYGIVVNDQQTDNVVYRRNDGVLVEVAKKSYVDESISNYNLLVGCYSGDTTKRLAMLTDTNYNNKDFLFKDITLGLVLQYQVSSGVYFVYKGQVELGVSPTTPSDGDYWEGTEAFYRWDDTNKYWSALILDKYISKQNIAKGSSHSFSTTGRVSFSITNNVDGTSDVNVIASDIDTINYRVENSIDYREALSNGEIYTLYTMPIDSNSTDIKRVSITYHLKKSKIDARFDILRFGDEFFITSQNVFNSSNVIPSVMKAELSQSCCEETILESPIFDVTEYKKGEGISLLSGNILLSPGDYKLTMSPNDIDIKNESTKIVIQFINETTNTLFGDPAIISGAGKVKGGNLTEFITVEEPTSINIKIIEGIATVSGWNGRDCQYGSCWILVEEIV